MSRVLARAAERAKANAGDLVVPLALALLALCVAVMIWAGGAA